jgi:hypothetical protein
MPGLEKGGHPYLKVTKKQIEYPAAGTVKAERYVLADVYVPPGSLTLKLGLRIKAVQQVDTFSVKATKNGQLLTMETANDLAPDLTATLGLAADEKWATYRLLNYNPAAHGKSFETTLVLSGYQIPDNGFQIVTIAVSHDDQTFAGGSYGFGLSLIPGKNNTSWIMPLGAGRAAAPQGKDPAAKGSRGASRKAKPPAARKAAKAPKKKSARKKKR